MYRPGRLCSTRVFKIKTVFYQMLRRIPYCDFVYMCSRTVRLFFLYFLCLDWETRDQPGKFLTGGLSVFFHHNQRRRELKNVTQNTYFSILDMRESNYTYTSVCLSVCLCVQLSHSLGVNVSVIGLCVSITQLQMKLSCVTPRAGKGDFSHVCLSNLSACLLW